MSLLEAVNTQQMKHLDYSVIDTMSTREKLTDLSSDPILANVQLSKYRNTPSSAPLEHECTIGEQ